MALQQGNAVSTRHNIYAHRLCAGGQKQQKIKKNNNNNNDNFYGAITHKNQFKGAVQKPFLEHCLSDFILSYSSDGTKTESTMRL